jgi:hypothetical protein
VQRRRQKPRIGQMIWLAIMFFAALALAHLNRHDWLVIP